MPQSFASAEVIEHIEIDYWNVDAFVGSQSFRCMRTKFPLSYYDRLVLVLAQVDKHLLDVIYADSDVLIATWDATRFLPVDKKTICQRLISVESRSRISEASDGTSNRVKTNFETPHITLRLIGETNYGFGRNVPNARQMDSLFAVILLGGITRKVSLVSNGELRLFSAALRSWITLQFVLLPNQMSERLAVMEEFISQYEKLARLFNTQAPGKTRENVIETVQMVTGTAAENTATIGIETTATSLGHAAAGVVLAVFVDIAVTASMLVRAKFRKDRGKITQQQYKKEIRERLFQAGCQFVAGTTGTIVGQVVVPVPVVGAAIGGFVGSLVGVGVSMGVSKIHKVVERARKRREMAMIEN